MNELWWEKVVLLDLDLSSAFDAIDHQILLDRLASFYGFSGLALSLLRSYLSYRTHHVVVQSSSSPAFHITTGVPHGSVLGPLLFSSHYCVVETFITRVNSVRQSNDIFVKAHKDWQVTTPRY